ncbi:hypothetical protein N7530_007173 [Penicillium desertorum]|uniref:GPI anchored protein n=1 Tax=Penicillium desertorum TaxID=1303715 RepID=A0A9W9WLS8_9EURO|nr:hypothetical protein N7530_007173 [Penicillium desertorum]
MRTQQLLPLCGLLLASVAIASKLDHDDVPNRCWPACGPVVGIANSCDARHERDSAEIQCICDWDAAKTQIPLCAACITQYQTDRRNHNITHHDHDDDDHDDDHDYDNDNDNDIDDDDNEALDLVRYCSLTTTTYNSAAATTVSTSTSTAGANTATTTDSSNAPTGTDSAGTGGSNSQDSTGLAGASAGSASSPTPTPDAAAGILAPGAASMAGVMGLMALAWL